MIARLAIATVLALRFAAPLSGQSAGDGFAQDLRALALLPGEPSRLAAAGITRGDERILTLESPGASDGPEKRLVVVGGLDGTRESTEAVLAAARWFKTSAPAATRRDWRIIVLPCAYPSRCSTRDAGAASLPVEAGRFPPEDGFYNDSTAPESRYVWRWVAFQAPDLVLEVRAGAAVTWEVSELAAGVRLAGPRPDAGSLAEAVSIGTPSGLAPVPGLRVATRVADAPAMLSELLDAAASLPRSPLHQALTARMSRTPLEVATLLAGRYPASAIMSYIPAVAWSNTLRLASRLGDASLTDKVRSQMAPFLSGERPTIAEPYLLTSLAGHFAFVDFALALGSEEALRLAIAGAEFILPQTANEIVRFPREWTDDMFMATSVLARAGARTGDARYAAAVGRLLTSYAERLQRADGLFVHAADGPHAWGRGNGFALLGLTEALTYLPADWDERPRILQIYRRHVEALARHQAPDGMWQQVVEEPGSYRELTVTAMTLVALARGVRLGWLDDSYRSVIERGWRGLTAHVAADGTLVDVCTGTGAGATKRYYLDRAAIFGADDRGGAMALWAAMEMADLQTSR